MSRLGSIIQGHNKKGRDILKDILKCLEKVSREWNEFSDQLRNTEKDKKGD